MFSRARSSFRDIRPEENPCKTKGIPPYIPHLVRYVECSTLAGNVIVLAPLLFQAFDEVLMDGRVNLRQKRFVEVVGCDQKNHVAEVGMAPRRQFELDQLG